MRVYSRSAESISFTVVAGYPRMSLGRGIRHAIRHRNCTSERVIRSKRRQRSQTLSAKHVHCRVNRLLCVRAAALEVRRFPTSRGAHLPQAVPTPFRHCDRACSTLPLCGRRLSTRSGTGRERTYVPGLILRKAPSIGREQEEVAVSAASFATQHKPQTHISRSRPLARYTRRQRPGGFPPN
jgi:hypothetical protein